MPYRYDYDREAWEAKHRALHLPPPLPLADHETEIYYAEVDAWWGMGGADGGFRKYSPHTENYRDAQSRGIVHIMNIRRIVDRLTEVAAANKTTAAAAISKTLLHEFKHLPNGTIKTAMRIFQATQAAEKK